MRASPSFLFGPGHNTALHYKLSVLGHLRPGPGCINVKWFYRESSGPAQKYGHILGARIWVGFARSSGRKTGGIASSLEVVSKPSIGPKIMAGFRFIPEQ